MVKAKGKSPAQECLEAAKYLEAVLNLHLPSLLKKIDDINLILMIYGIYDPRLSYPEVEVPDAIVQTETVSEEFQQY